MEKIIRYFVVLLIVFLSLTGKSHANPYAPYKGKTLVVRFPSHPHFDAVIKVLPEFTKETGIKVEVDQLHYLKIKCNDRGGLSFINARGDYDLVTYYFYSKSYLIINRDCIYTEFGNLSKYFMSPKLVDPNYDADDLVDAYVQTIGVAGGKKGYLPGKTGSLFGLPSGGDTSALAYRKDIFEKHGLKVPETYEDLIEVACKIPTLELGMGGLSSRAASGHQAAHAFLLHFNSLGGRIFDDQWNPILNNDVGVKAAKTLKKLIECGPKGAEKFGFGEAFEAFLQGKTAMYLDTTVVAHQMNNPKKSKVVGKVAWAPHPKGIRHASSTGGFGLAIPKNAKNKEAAFLLMQWLTSKKGDKLIALAGGQPSRYSTHFDSEVNKKYPYMKVLGKALKHADPDWRPIIPEWGKINADLATTMSKIITKNFDPQKGLDAVAERTRKIMKEAGYYTWKK